MGKQPSDDGDHETGDAGRILRAAEAGRSRLLADATLIDALVRLEEVEVAARAIEEQRADLVEYAIDLSQAVAQAVAEAVADASGRRDVVAEQEAVE